MSDDGVAHSETGEKLDEEQLQLLGEYAISLTTTDPTVEFEQTARLAALFEDADIVALGEATHGTREFFQLKHRLLRYLVGECGIRLFALEANFSETLAINEYVVYGRGDPETALDGIYFWTWNVESVLSMIEWLREFNDGRPLDDRVRFYGIDSQYTSGAVQLLQAYFESVDLRVPAQIREDLATVDDEGTSPAPPESADRERWLQAGERLVAALRQQLSDYQETCLSRTSESAWELARQHVTVIEQALAYRRAQMAYARQDDDETLRKLIRIRDRAMADTVEWLLEWQEHDRLALWAHDAHINRSKQTVRGTDVSAPSLGRFLVDEHGEDYVAVGFSFGRGSFQAITDSTDDFEVQGQTLLDPVSGTIDETLDSLGMDLALIDIRAATQDERLSDLLTRQQPHFSVGATYEPGSPAEYITEYVYADAFDAVCFVAETTRARSLDHDIPE